MLKKRVNIICKILEVTVLLLALLLVSACNHPKIDLSDENRIYYEIFVRSFYDSDGDGVGDLNGVEKKIPYLKELNVTGIYLMPVFESPSYHKYDVTDYNVIDPAYGNLQDFEKLIKECHQNNIRVIIDFPINHTSSMHPWFLEACDYLRSLAPQEEPDETVCPAVSYYHFSKEKKNGYAEVTGTDYFYEAQFYYGMPDLNLQNEELIHKIYETVDFWISKGVDGFRMDAAMHFEEGDDAFNKQVLQDLYTHCRTINENFYLVSEVYAGKETILNYIEPNEGSFFNFHFAGAEGILIKAARGKMKGTMLSHELLSYEEEAQNKNPSYVDATFLSNHDMSRVENMLQGDLDAMKFASGLLFTLSGSPFLYYGEEVGMQSKGMKDENKRLPMPWGEEGTTSLFSNADPVEQTMGTVLLQEKDPDSLLSYYKRASEMRMKYPLLSTGKTEVLEEVSDDSFAIIRKTDSQDNAKSIIVVYNISVEQENLSLSFLQKKPKSIDGLTLHGDAVEVSDGCISVPGRSIIILEE